MSKEAIIQIERHVAGRYLFWTTLQSDSLFIELLPFFTCID